MLRASPPPRCLQWLHRWSPATFAFPHSSAWFNRWILRTSPLLFRKSHDAWRGERARKESFCYRRVSQSWMGHLFCASLPLALLPISTESGVGFSRLLSLIPRESDSRGDHDGFLSKKEFFTRGNVLALSTVGRFAEMSEWLSGCVQDTARLSPQGITSP